MGSAVGSSCVFVLWLVTSIHAAENALPPIEGLPFEIGRLDSASVTATHPRLFFSPEEIARAKGRVEKEENARKTFDHLITEADEQLTVEIEPIDESWWEAAKDKPWGETYPEVFENTWANPLAYAKPAATLATAWLLTGEQRYAEKAVAMLMNLAPYSFRAEHYDVGMNYSVWCMNALQAYDVLLGPMSAEQRRAFDSCMTRLARAVARNDVYWIDNNIGGGINNHLAWHKAMLGLLGLFYGRHDMIDYCMHGRRGLIPLLEDGLLDDGLWCESSLNYQFTAIAPMIIVADCQRRMGHRPGLHEITTANGRTLKQSYDAMFNVLAADGLIPPIGDAYGYHRKLWSIPQYEYCWALWGDSKYAWLINHNPAPSSYSLFAPPVLKDAPPPPIRSILLPEHGYAFLRSHADEQYWDTDAWCAFLTYDRSGVHANADKLGLTLFGQKRMLLSDVEGRATVPHAFSSRIQRELNRGALSQNTVMIDGRDQRYCPKMLRLVEFRDLPDEKRVTAADDEGLLYEGVRQMRTVAMTPDYVLDVFQVDCGEAARQIDWVTHVLNENATTPADRNPILAECEPFELPDAGAWRWLRDAKSMQPKGPIQMEWREGEARLRLRMLDPGAERVILCGYPFSDEPDPLTIPMIMVRKQGKHAVFAAVWLVGDAIKRAELSQLPPHDGKLVYEVTADARTRRHLLPQLLPGR